MELKGKVAIVTGGAVRLGRALALALAERRARLVIHYNSSAAAANETVETIEGMGSDALALQADFAQPGAAAAIVDKSADYFGQVDILVNSAAVFEAGGWDNTTESNWDRHFSINLKSPFFLCQALARHVGQERPGHIVNIADWRGERQDTDHLAYTLTKAGLIALTRSLALALAPNIRVNAIAPGLILPPPGKDESYLVERAEEIPAGRAGSPEEIGRALVYLLESDFVTGELLHVTGGEHL